MRLPLAKGDHLGHAADAAVSCFLVHFWLSHAALELPADSHDWRASAPADADCFVRLLHDAVVLLPDEPQGALQLIAGWKGLPWQEFVR